MTLRPGFLTASPKLRSPPARRNAQGAADIAGADLKTGHYETIEQRRVFVASTLAVVHHRLCCTRPTGGQNAGRKKWNSIATNFGFATRCRPNGIGLCPLVCRPVDHHSGSTGG